MFMAFFSWWYGDGWKRQFHAVTAKLAGLVDAFSIEIIIRTIFSPFRQISAGSVNGPLAVQFRAFIDNLVSRVIGAMVRITVLLVGSLIITVMGVLSAMYLAVWPLIPVMPVIIWIGLFVGVLYGV